MKFQFVVDVEVSREEGQFRSRDDVESELIEALSGADPGNMDIDGSSYNTDSWDIGPGLNATAKNVTISKVSRTVAAEQIKRAGDLIAGVFGSDFTGEEIVEKLQAAKRTCYAMAANLRG